MPILLNNLDQDLENAATQAANVKVYSPKFFDQKLTGRGGSYPGLLSLRNNPPAVPPAKDTEDMYCNVRKIRTIHNGATNIYQFPINPICPKGWDIMSEIKYPDPRNMTVIGHYSHRNRTQTSDLYVKMDVTAFTIEETIQTNFYTGMTKKDVTFTPAYQMMFYNIVDPSKPTCKKANAAYHLSSTNENTYMFFYTNNPIKDWNDNIASQLVGNNFTVDHKAFMDYMMAYEVYDSACEQSERWQEQMDKILEEFFDNLKKHGQSSSQNQRYVQGIAETEMKYIMCYNIPLDLYRTIYKSVTSTFQPQDAKDICKQNLNLLLSDTLHNLDRNKGQIQTFQTPNPQVPLPQSVQNLSKQQMAATMSTDPLILVQAGAGTGKSTLILGRIDYLNACGVKPEDITVLSFTNAAADHITEKNPNVHSMTIASMIHEIYSTNFQNHELSQQETLINSLEIYFPTQMQDSKSVQYQFGKRLTAMVKKETNNFTEMNNFIEDHYDEVISILDTLKQTSLELEIMICYQKIDTFREPPTVQSKFLIIDEVQDNSIFEFVYALKYIDKHKESLFIVGDCSQTLYEFRASNPRALNILEGSGTFQTYQLDINYRSNQEILDMANVLLENIEANQYAQLQLQANSRAQVTEQSFLEKVKFNYRRLNKITDLQDSLPSIFAREIRPYINQCLAKGEQIAILAYERRIVAKVKETLTNQFTNLNPDTDIISLVSDKSYNETVMSKFICKYWNQVKFAPAQNIMAVISHEIMQKLPYLVYQDQKAAPKIQNMLNKWRTQEGATIATWYNQFTKGQITQDEFLSYVKENMLQFEIRTNAIKQSMTSARNQETKQSQNIANAKILVSTIHGAKGLEFDNVIVLYKNANNMPEDDKRMYYVAFTRAMKSEYILAYDTMVSPQIEQDYFTVLEALHAKAPAPNSPITARAANKTIKI